MTTEITEKHIENLENDLKALRPAVAQLDKDINKVNARRDVLKKDLRDNLQTVKDMGEDPDNLPDTIRRLYEVARTKTDVIKEEVRTGNEIIQPILKEME